MQSLLLSTIHCALANIWFSSENEESEKGGFCGAEVHSLIVGLSEQR